MVNGRVFIDRWGVMAIDFAQLYDILTQALGPLCVLFAPTMAIERALIKSIKAEEKINSN